MTIKKITFLIVFLLTSTTVIAQDFSKNNFKKKFDKKLGALSLETSNKIGIAAGNAVSNFAEDKLDQVKYLDFDFQVQENFKPTFNVMSVTEILKIKSGTIFNQTSLNTYDQKQTINVGFGIRKLLNNNTIILGSNIFYDHQFAEKHYRSGLGVEAISSIFDVRGND